MKYLIQKERTHLFAPSINIALCVKIPQIIDETLLRKSIEKAVLNNEVLNCKIIMDEDGHAYYETNDTKVLHIEKTNDDLISIINIQEKNPFDIEKGELIKFFIKYDKSDTYILAIAHHLAGDGLAITYLMQDIMKSINNKPLGYKKLQLFDVNSIANKKHLNFVIRILLNKIKSDWAKSGKVFSFDEYRKMKKKYWDKCEPQILYEEISEDTLQKLKDKAKSNNVSINSVITTLIAKYSMEKDDIGLTVSLRPPNNYSMANYASAISIKNIYNKSKDFWDNAKYIHKSIYKKINGNEKYFLSNFMNSIPETLIDAAYFSAFNDYDNKNAKNINNMFGYGYNPKGINISNLTNINLNEQNSKIRISKCLFIPPIVPNASCIFGIATLENKMVITYHIIKNKEYHAKKELFQNVINGFNEII